MRNEKIFDLVAWLLIASVGLASAYVCFGLLSSQASTSIQQYSVGGAIAGALISWSVLTSLYLQLRGSSNELQELRKRTEELQSKLIRGAPRPQGFDTEVDERQRIVLARPKDWEPKGGIVFQLELPDEKMKPTDNFAATFLCSFVPIEKESKQTREQFHESQLQELKATHETRFVQSYSHEVIRLGGEAGEVECLKVIAHYVARVEIKPSRETGRRERTWAVISWQDFVGEIHDIFPTQVHVDEPITLYLAGMGFRDGAACYVNRKKRTTKVSNQWQAEVILAAEDVIGPSVLEVVIENPGTNGKQSNTKVLPVVQAPHDKQAFEEMAPTAGVGQIAAELSPPGDTTPAAANTLGERPPSELVAPSSASKAEVHEVFQEIVLMRVACYHKALEKIYYFDFWDDEGDFLNSSDVFNRILASTRFLS